MSYFAIFFGGCSNSSKKWDNMYKILFRFVPLHLKTDRMGLSIRLTLIGIMSRRFKKCNDFRWQCLKKTTSPTSLAVFWWCLLRPKKDPRMGTSAGWTSSIPWRFCWQWSSRVFFRDLHHRNLDNEQRWFTVDFEFYVEIPCSLKHFFSRSSRSQNFSQCEVTATGAFGSGPSHIARHLRPSVKVPKKGSLQSPRRTSWKDVPCGAGELRWDVPYKWILIYGKIWNIPNKWL